MIKWTEQYNCYSAKIAKGAITLSVAWNSFALQGSPGGYVVIVGGRKLKELIRDIDAAKAVAVELAKKIVAEAQAELEDA